MKKIVVLGPESTGKSFLCKQLADHYHSQWVPEFARDYLETNGAAYRFEDLYTIALGQIQSEERSVSNHPLPRRPFTAHRSPYTTPPLFIDTDLYTIKIWSEISFNKCDNRILSQIAEREYDLFLLCNTDLPWAPDPLREYPDLEMRKRIHHYYLDALLNQPKPWADISGDYQQRFDKAVAAVDKILQEV